MTRTVTLYGYAVLALAAAAYQAAGLRWRRTPTLGRALSVVTGWPPTRWLLLSGWLWLGWHLFVRTDPG